MPWPPPYPQPKGTQDLHKQTSRGRPQAGSGCSPPGQSRNQQFQKLLGLRAELQLRPSRPQAHTPEHDPLLPTQGRLPTTRAPAAACPLLLLFFSPLSQAMPASFTWAVIPSIMDTASTSVTCTTKRSCDRAAPSSPAQLIGSTSLSPLPDRPHHGQPGGRRLGTRTGTARPGQATGRFSPAELD